LDLFLGLDDLHGKLRDFTAAASDWLSGLVQNMKQPDRIAPPVHVCVRGYHH
jgi:hypothetical protein